MKLIDVLKGHCNDNVVVVVNHRFDRRVEWSGKGIKHVVEKYANDWLKNDVQNVTKDKLGKTIITLK